MALLRLSSTPFLLLDKQSLNQLPIQLTGQGFNAANIQSLIQLAVSIVSLNLL